MGKSIRGNEKKTKHSFSGRHTTEKINNSRISTVACKKHEMKAINEWIERLQREYLNYLKSEQIRYTGKKEENNNSSKSQIVNR